MKFSFNHDVSLFYSRTFYRVLSRRSFGIDFHGEYGQLVVISKLYVSILMATVSPAIVLDHGYHG